ncbi:MAG: DUF4416 family protein [Elusimicrobiota bacterium]
MGKIQAVKPVKLFCALIYSNKDIYNNAKNYLIEKFGDIDIETIEIEFIFTDYYKNEMGETLTRRFLSFRNLINPADLSGIKHITNDIESSYLESGNRKINIDPGYLDEAKVVLATTKDYTHRVYIGENMYAEVTLYFNDKIYKPWPWTYPDYKTKEYIGFFMEMRGFYREKF